MKKFDDNSALQSFELIEQVEKLSAQENSLRSQVEKALNRYFNHIEESLSPTYTEWLFQR